MRRPQDNGGDVARPWVQEPAADYYPQQPSSMRDQAEEVLNLLMRRKWIVLVICALVVAGGAYYTLNQTPTYESSGLVMITDRNQSQTGPQREGEATGTRVKRVRSVRGRRRTSLPEATGASKTSC